MVFECQIKMILPKRSIMSKRDILKENINLLSPIIERMDTMVQKNLNKTNNTYCELVKEQDELEEKYDFLRFLFEGSNKKLQFTKEEVSIINDYVRIFHRIQFYKSFEYYKLGMYDYKHLNHYIDEFDFNEDINLY